MAAAITAAVSLCQDDECECAEHDDAFDMRDEDFMRAFHLTKPFVQWLCDQLWSSLHPRRKTRQTLPVEQHVLCATVATICNVLTLAKLPNHQKCAFVARVVAVAFAASWAGARGGLVAFGAEVTRCVRSGPGPASAWIVVRTVFLMRI